MQAENYKLYLNGHYVRIATKVILHNGKEIKFVDKLSKKEAFKNARYQIEKHPEIWGKPELMIYKA